MTTGDGDWISVDEYDSRVLAEGAVSDKELTDEALSYPPPDDA